MGKWKRKTRFSGISMKRIGEIITSVFDESMMKKADECSAFFDCWKDITEKNRIPAVAAHSWIKSLDNGLVWIEVNHPGCKQILQTKKRKLLHDFRYRFPQMGISDISIMLCRPGTHPESAKNEPAPELANGTKKEQIADQPSSVSEITEEEMQNPKYDDIKNKTLKRLLMRLEKNIAERKPE